MPFIIIFFLLLFGCQHEVSVKAPTEPIVINLNVDLKHKISVQMTEDVKDAIEKNDKIF